MIFSMTTEGGTDLGMRLFLEVDSTEQSCLSKASSADANTHSRGVVLYSSVPSKGSFLSFVTFVKILLHTETYFSARPFDRLW